MDNIICSDCKISKPPELFNKHKNRPNGCSSVCKKCSSKRFRIYSRTLEGLITIIYNHQIGSSKKRNHNLPNYSKKELYEWITKQPNFKNLYEDWIGSNFSKNLRPSVDRLDDYKPYTLDNIGLTNWEANKEKGSEDRKNGVNNKKNTSVIQLDKDTNNVIEIYHSISEASRKTGISRTGISKVCIGKLETSGNFKWRYE